MPHPFVTLDPHVCHGKPCIRGTRILVETILDLVAQGYAFEDIRRQAYPELTHEQLADAVAFVNDLLRSEEMEPASPTR